MLTNLPVTTNHSAQTTGADVNPLKFTVNHDALTLHIGTELAIGRALRVTYIVSEHRAFTTNLTFSHNIPLDLSVTGILYQKG